MEPKEVVVNRGSIELIVIGLLAALVVAMAFPMLSGVKKEDSKESVQPREEWPNDALPVE